MRKTDKYENKAKVPESTKATKVTTNCVFGSPLSGADWHEGATVVSTDRSGEKHYRCMTCGDTWTE